MTGMRFEQVITGVMYAAKAADVHGNVGVTLTFDSPRDRAVFEARLMMELHPSRIDPMGWRDGEVVICGVRVHLEEASRKAA